MSQLRQEFQNWITESTHRTMYSSNEVRDRLLDMLIALRSDEEAGIAIDVALAEVALEVQATPEAV